MKPSIKPENIPTGKLSPEALQALHAAAGIDRTPELINDSNGSDLRPYGWGMFFARLCALAFAYCLLLPAVFFTAIFFFSSFLEGLQKNGSANASSHLMLDNSPVSPLFGPASLAAWLGFVSVSLIWLIGRKVPAWISLASVAAGAACIASFGSAFLAPAFFAFPAFALIAAAHFFPSSQA